MFAVYEDAEFVCVALEDTDFDVFVEAQSVCWLDKKPSDAEFVRGLRRKQKAIMEDARDYWSDAFDSADTVHFVLFAKAETPFEKDRALGVARIQDNDDIEGAVLFCSLHVLSDHRGGHLSAILHRARENYVADYTEHDTAITEILESNHGSLEMAKRAGFVEVDRFEIRGRMTLILEKPISRSNPHDPILDLQA